MRGATVKTGWDQDEVKLSGAAVFGADKAPSSLTPSEIPAGDWPYASLYYTDRMGRTINTGSYGAGEWQLSYTSYDANGNLSRELNARDIAGITSGETTSQKAGTLTRYNT